MTYYEEKTRAGMKYCVVSADKGYVVVIYHYAGKGTRWFWSFQGEKLHRVNSRFIKNVAPALYRFIKDHSGLKEYNVL